MTRLRSLASRRWLVALGAGLLIAALGVGAYLLGRSSGEDLEQARATGVAVGLKHGTASGRKDGYREGFRDGLEGTFDSAYGRAYKKAYRAEFLDAELKPPDRIEVPAAEPPR